MAILEQAAKPPARDDRSRLASGKFRLGKQDLVAGVAGSTSKLDPPSAIVYTEEHPTFADARHREAQLKRWSRAKREALVAGDASALRRLAKSRNHDK